MPSNERPIFVHYGPSRAQDASAPPETLSDALPETPTLYTPAAGVGGGRLHTAVATADMAPAIASSAAPATDSLGSPDTPTPIHAPWSPLIKQAFLLWVGSRLLLVIFTLVAAALLARHGERALLTSPGGLLGLWREFDTTAYLRIAESGYSTPFDPAFFPLYPLLIAGPAHLLGARLALPIGLLISNLGAFAALLGLARLAVDEGGDGRVARNAQLALLAYPMAFFLGAAYTEGPFIAAAVWCLWAMRRGKWPLATACALVAALLRPTGVILYLPLLYEFARQHAWGRRLGASLTRTVAQALAVALASPLGIGLYSLYCARRFGDPLAWVHAEARYWGRPTTTIWQALHDTLTYIVSLRPLSLEQDKKLVDYLAIAAVLALTIALARRQPIAFTLYLAGLLYLTLSAPFVVSASAHYAVYLSASRYMLPAVPLYLAIGRWSRQSPLLALVALLALVIGLALQAVFAVYFLQGGWVA